MGQDYIRLYRASVRDKVANLKAVWADQWMTYYDLEVPTTGTGLN